MRVVWSVLLNELLRRRTHALEVFLAIEAILAGLWLLWPGPKSFKPPMVLYLIPDPILGAIMLSHGIASMLALWKNDVERCRHAALASAAIWSFLMTLMIFSPPVELFMIPLVAGLVVASVWVYVRLYVLFARPRSRGGA